MRSITFLLAICLLFSTAAAAQGPAGVGSQNGPWYSAAGDHRDDPWQLAISYQYNRDNLIGSPFNTHGINISGTRFFGRWFGAEAQVGVGFLEKPGRRPRPRIWTPNRCLQARDRAWPCAHGAATNPGLT